MPLNVRDSAAVVCHGTLLLSYEIVRAEKFRVDDLLARYNSVLRGSADSFEADVTIVNALQQVDDGIVSLRDVSTANYVGAILGIAAAHTALKDAVENPDPDFQAIFEQLETLVGQFEGIREATSALTSS